MAGGELAGAWVFYSVAAALAPRAPGRASSRIARFAPWLRWCCGGLQACSGGHRPSGCLARLRVALVCWPWLFWPQRRAFIRWGDGQPPMGLAAGERSLEGDGRQPGGASGVLAFTLLLLCGPPPAEPAAAASAAVGGARCLLVSRSGTGWRWLLAIGAIPLILRQDGTAGFHRSHWLRHRREFCVPRLLPAGRTLAAPGGTAAGGRLGSGRGWLAGCCRRFWCRSGLGRRLRRPQRDSVLGPCVEWTDSLALAGLKWPW